MQAPYGKMRTFSLSEKFLFHCCVFVSYLYSRVSLKVY